MKFVIWSIWNLIPVAKIEAPSIEEAYKQLGAKTIEENGKVVHYLVPPGRNPDEIDPIAVISMELSEAIDLLLRGPRGDDKPRREILSLEQPVVRMEILANGEEFLKRIIEGLVLRQIRFN